MKTQTLLVIIAFAVLGGCQVKLKYAKFPEVYTVGTINVIAPDSVKVDGVISSDGGAKISACGVCWDTVPDPTISKTTKTTEPVGANSFHSVLCSLKNNTTYYARSYAVNEVGVSYGNQVTFTTKGSVPTIQTTGIAYNTATSFTAGGAVLSDGNWPVLTKGICWAYGHVPTVDNADGVVSSNSSLTVFDITVNIANKGANIHVRAFASNKIGTAYGEDKIFYPGSAHTIGEYANGGIIFYIDNSGYHGYVVSSTAQSAASWGCEGTNISLASKVALGTGQQNTQGIVASCTQSAIAASICDNLFLSGYGDWFLPSEIELTTLYYSMKLNQINTIDMFGNKRYWTSTQADANNAFTLDFATGNVLKITKHTSQEVRAIRSF